MSWSISVLHIDWVSSNELLYLTFTPTQQSNGRIIFATIS